MNMASNIVAALSTVADIEDEKDVVGGGGGPLESDIYPAKVELAYLEKSEGGALALNLRLKTSAGKDIRQSLWMTSGDKKGNKNYYVDKEGNQKYLPGFLLANSLGLLTVGKEIGELAGAAENKVVKLYSFTEKKEVPTEVPVLVELLGQEIYAAVIKQVVDKNAKAADGSYQPTGETREENEIDKFFRAKDKMTTAEIRAGAEEPAFFNTWKEKWAGQVKDRSTKTSGQAGAPKPAGASPAAKKPTASLFG